MPRKAFVADLNEAVVTFERSNVSNFRGGDEDGQINFLYQQNYQGEGTEITVLVPGKHPRKLMKLCLKVTIQCAGNAQVGSLT